MQGERKESDTEREIREREDELLKDEDPPSQETERSAPPLKEVLEEEDIDERES